MPWQETKPQHAPKAPLRSRILNARRRGRSASCRIHPPVVQSRGKGRGHHSDVRFRAHRIQETAQARCTRLKDEKTARCPRQTAKHRADVRHARSCWRCRATTKKPRAFAKLTTWSLTLGQARRFVVCSGRAGNYGRANRGAYDAAAIVGLSMSSARAYANPYISPELSSISILLHAQTVVRAARKR